MILTEKSEMELQYVFNLIVNDIFAFFVSLTILYLENRG